MKRIDPALKFICLLAITVVMAWKYSLMLNIAVFLACLILIFAAGVPAKKTLLLLTPVFLAAAGMFFTGYRFSSGSGMPVNEAILHLGSSALANGLTQACRVLAYAGVGYLFALTTDRIAMVKSFRRRFHLPQVFAYGLLAAWGVFPRMMLEYRRTKAAFRARGIRVFPVSPALLRPLLVKSVRWSEALSVAMESRGFNSRAKRVEFEPPKFCTADWIFLGAAVCFCAAAGIFL
ncbi:MAG: energy-coupling factor transporter transmembrane protein EcfT [Clostridia bacterium]|nr:energy-coupling factor transporter transmembrane protein EcfT [Clostridia bacterium]